MSKKAAYIIIASVAAYVLLTKVRRVVSGLDWRIAGMRVLSSDPVDNSSLVSLRLQLRNTSPFSVVLSGVDGVVYIHGVECASISQALNQTIYANAISTVDLQFTLYWQGIAEAIKQNILSGNIANLTVRFAGDLIVEGRRIAIDKTITYDDLVQ